MIVRPKRTRPHLVRFYFSYRSPFSWLATARLPVVLDGMPVAVEYWPVWEPDPLLATRLATQGLTWNFPPLTRRKRHYIFQDVRRLARAYGLPLVWPIDRDPEWSLPHLGLLFAREHGRERSYHEQVFAHRFTRGDNVTDPIILARIADEVGLDGASLLRSIHDERYAETAVSCFRQADEDGVFGWPFFVYGRDRFWGHDRLTWLAEAIRLDHSLPEGPR